MFYTFRQNNSGGVFVFNETLTLSVTIEAKNADDANNRAMELGIYFNGCYDGKDCECCGDRWQEVTDKWDAKETPYVGDDFDSEGRLKVWINWTKELPGKIIYYLDSRVEKIYVSPEPLG